MKSSLVLGSALKCLPALSKFVSAVNTPHEKRSPAQKEALSSASKESIEALASDAEAAHSHLAALQLAAFAMSMLCLMFSGPSLNKLTKYFNVALSDWAFIGLAWANSVVAIASMVLLFWAMSKEGLTSSAIRLLAPVTPTKTVTEAREAAKSVPESELYRQEAIKTRGKLYQFDLEVILDLAQKERDKSEFYQKDFEALNSTAPLPEARR